MNITAKLKSGILILKMQFLVLMKNQNEEKQA
jgi:hypothetical protein